MSVSKNWSAEIINGTAGFEIIVRGEANVGLLAVMPELEKRVPQGKNPAILQLDLLQANDATPENYHQVQYNELLEREGQYQSVDIFHEGKVIETVKVKSV